MAIAYDFDAVMDIGNGWEPYEGCMLSLLMILEDQDTGIEVINEGSEAINESCVFSIKHYFITLV